MSVNLLILESRSSDLHITAFYGGKERERCIQVSIEDRYIELTKDQVEKLVKTLNTWMKG